MNRVPVTKLALLNAGLTATALAGMLAALAPEPVPSVNIEDEGDIAAVDEAKPAPSIDAALGAPLFTGTRAPPPRTIAAETPAATTVPPVVTGVILDPQGHLAIAADADSGKQRLYRIGQEVMGWTVVRIGAKAVTLRAGEDETVVLVRPETALTDSSLYTE